MQNVENIDVSPTFGNTVLPAVVGSQKKYQIVYADPAWKISYYPRENRKKMKWDNYPTMKLEDIKALHVNDITADNCVLFLSSDFSDASSIKSFS